MAKRPATGMDDEALKLQELDRRLRALESNVRGAISGDGTDTFLRSGNFIVNQSGALQFLANDGTVILEIDKDAFTYDRADGTRQLEVTPAGGLKVYASNGTTERMVVDGDGLDVGGGLTVIDGDGITVKDAAGNVVFRRTTTAPWRPTRSLFPWPDAVETTTSSSYDILWRSGIIEVWEEGVYIVVVASCDSGTTYDLQFGAQREGDVTPTDSEEITGLTNTTASTFSRKFAITYDVSAPKGSGRIFSIAARRTGGSGQVKVTIHFVWRVGTLSDLGSELG